MEKKYPPRVYIFKYKDEQGNEFYEADLKPFAKNNDDQYLSKEEHDAIVQPLVEALTFYMNHVHAVHYGTQTGQTSYVHEKGKAAREALENYKKQTGE